MSVATSRAPSRAPASRPRRRARRGRRATTRALLATTRGTCTAHGLDGAFELTHDARGTTFVERVTLARGDDADALTTESGRDDDGTTWDADWYGDRRATTLDGAHASAMMTWVRTNQWNDELAAAGRLRRKKLAEGVEATAALRRYGVEAPTPAKVEKRGRGRAKRRTGREFGGFGGFGASSDARAPRVPRCATSVYAVSMLDGGRVGGRVFVDEATGFAWRAEFYHQRGVETWMFEGWERVAVSETDEVAVPRLAHRTHAEGQVTTFRAESTSSASEDRETYAALPSSSVAPWASERAWSGDDATIATCRGEGGHILVKATLESSDDGGASLTDWFVLDTASTGLAVAPHVADAVSMPSFGSMAIVGVAAPLEGALRRGKKLSVGALSLSSPIFMEQNLDGALRVPNGERLAGVIGLSVLGAHAIVRIHAPLRVPGSRDPPKLDVRVFRPEAYEPSAEIERAWEPVVFIDGVPYVECSYTIANDGFQGVTEMTTERRGLFKLALGTGGVGVVLGDRVAVEADVANRTKALRPGGIMSGPGESAGRLQRVGDEIVTGRIETVRFKSFEFKNVRAVVHLDGAPPDADLSPHADGAACADLFRGCEFVLDLRPSNPRIAVCPP